MATATQFRHEDVATVPRGYRVRTVKTGSHQVRIAFPPGPRKKGAGRLVSILHPKAENQKKCMANSHRGTEERRKNRTLRMKWDQMHPESRAELASRAGMSPGFFSGKSWAHLQDWERLLLQDAMKAGSRGKASVNARGNSSAAQPFGKLRTAGQAQQLYTDFHGRAPSEILTMQEALMASGDYTALGDMGSLWLETVKGEPSDWPAPDIEFEKKDKVKLATDSKGKQLYLVGGNQKIPLDYLEKHGVSTDKRFISLGEVYGISYLTTKSFDGYRDSEYAHEFGEDTGERPFAFYDAELERIVLVGGGYTIASVDDVLGASPGIVN